VTGVKDKILWKITNWTRTVGILAVIAESLEDRDKKQCPLFSCYDSRWSIHYYIFLLLLLVILKLKDYVPIYLTWYCCIITLRTVACSRSKVYIYRFSVKTKGLCYLITCSCGTANPLSTWQTVRKVRHSYSSFLWYWHDWNAERGMFFILIPFRLHPDIGGLNALILAVLILWVWKIHSLVINTIAWVLEADFLKLNDNSIGEACDKAPVALCLLTLKVPWRSLAQK